MVKADHPPDDDLRFVMAVCSSYAYGDTATVAMIMARLGLAENHCFMVTEYVDVLFLTSTAYLIQSRDGRVVILCYRGTPPTSLITWLTDLEVSPVRIKMQLPVGSGMPDEYDVHGGFYRNVRSTRPTIIDALKQAIEGHSVRPDGGKLDHELEALYITGHSLCGAIAAMLVAMLIADSAYQPIVTKLKAVYTFGAPMIGSREFAQACNKIDFLRDNVIRYVYANDVVPQVPPTESGQFEHFGQEFQYKPAGNRGHWRPSRTTQTSNLLGIVTTPVSFLAKQFPLARNIPFHTSINDHLPQYYIDALTPAGVRSEFGD
jgi:Lipase (class 3)